MSLTRLLPHLRGFRIDAVTAAAERVVLAVSLIRRTAARPACQRRSTRVHRRYRRTLADLPLGGRPVVLKVRVRRYYCLADACPRQIFAERLPALTTVRGRRTLGQQTALTTVGFALGGAPGARLGARLGLFASRSTLLRLVRAAPLPETPAPRILGVDDWALRKGHCYGSVLVDLERHRPVDLLADRTADTFAQWLTTHDRPGVISRDRAGAYAEGARQGAPAAVQVADRFHLLANAGEVLERVLGRQHAALRAAAAAVDAQRPADQPAAAAPELADAAEVVATPPSRAHPEQEARRGRRQARYEQVVALHTAGHSQAAISAHLHISRRTVRRYVRAGHFPERAQPQPRPTQITPHLSYLHERWAAGCHNAQTLWEELWARGFTGGPASVRRQVAGWRRNRRGSGRAAVPAGRCCARSPSEMR